MAFDSAIGRTGFLCLLSGRWSWPIQGLGPYLAIALSALDRVFEIYATSSWPVFCPTDAPRELV
jgi:hypothetical protein